MLESISLILNALFGGGLVLTLATLKSTRKQAKQDTDKSLVANFDEFIVSPLKTEVNELRTSITKLNRAISKISTCPHAASCPVRDSLEHSDSADNNELQDTEDHEGTPV